MQNARTNRPDNTTTSRRRNVAGSIAAALTVVSAVVAPTTSQAATKSKPPKTAAKPKPAAGLACSPVGTRAAGTTLDCVRVGSKLQWQPRGSKLNPFRLGESFEWTQSSNGTAPGALISTRRITITGYLSDASEWVSSFPDNNPKDIFDLAKGVQVRGVQASYTLVDATDESSRALGSLTQFWLGNDADAGCCTQGLLNWGTPPSTSLDAYTRLDAGATRSGTMLFARTDEQLAARPLLRLTWLDARTTNNVAVYFDVTQPKA